MYQRILFILFLVTLGFTIFQIIFLFDYRSTIIGDKGTFCIYAFTYKHICSDYASMRSFQLPIKFIGVLRWCRYTHYKCRNQFSSIQKWWLLGLPKNTRCKNHWYKICIYGPSTPLAPTKHRFVFEEDEKVARVYKTKQNYCRHWKLLLYICLNIQDNILTYTDNFMLPIF